MSLLAGPSPADSSDETQPWPTPWWQPMRDPDAENPAKLCPDSWHTKAVKWSQGIVLSHQVRSHLYAAMDNKYRMLKNICVSLSIEDVPVKRTKLVIQIFSVESRIMEAHTIMLERLRMSYIVPGRSLEV